MLAALDDLEFENELSLYTNEPSGGWGLSGFMNKIRITVSSPQTHQTFGAMRGAALALVLFIYTDGGAGAVVPLADTATCPHVESGIDYYAHDAGNVTNVASADACCAACTADPGCSVWTLWVSKKVCFKKTSAAGRDAVTDRISGGTYPPPTPPPAGTWQAIASMPSPRLGLGLGVLDGVIYAVGGKGTSALASAAMYRPSNDTWSAIASMSTPRQGLGVGVLDGTVYAVGGAADDGTTLATLASAEM